VALARTQAASALAAGFVAGSTSSPQARLLDSGTPPRWGSSESYWTLREFVLEHRRTVDGTLGSHLGVHLALLVLAPLCLVRPLTLTRRSAGTLAAAALPPAGARRGRAEV
jgi:hypothetical protein